MTTDLKLTTHRLTPPSAAEVEAMAPEDLYPVPGAKRFEFDDFIDAPDLEAIADLLIARWPELQHVRHARVRYLWKSDGSGRAQARTTRASGFWRKLSDIDVVVWLGAKPLRGQFYTREQVEGTLYHELKHIDWNPEKARVELVEHDAEVFFDEFRRYGIRRQDHARFGQLSLDGHLQRGQGLTPSAFGYCSSCGEVIRLADGCDTCIALEEAAKQPRPIRPLVACSSCGVQHEEDAPPLVGGVCVDCREEAALGYGDDQDGDL